jgi:long-chain fatty acid transport protein
MTKTFICVTTMVVAAFTVTTAAGVQAAGYQIGQDSVSGAGVAYAGGTAAAGDASTVFANPAGMTRLDGRQVVIGGHLLRPGAKFTNEGSIDSGAAAITGGDGGQGGVGAFIPNFYGVWSLPNDLKFGLGINAPYGLAVDWNEDWVGRYNELGAAIATVNVNPALAYRINDRISIGGGLNLMYGRARLTQAIDFGTIQGVAAQSRDGSSDFSGDDVAFGVNVGALFALNANTRIGVQFRSGMEFHFDGEVDFSVPAAARAALDGDGNPNAFTDGNMRGDLPIPETASISVFHDVPNSQWALMADLTWTRWEVFDRLVLTPEEPTSPTSVIDTLWDNKFRASAGATYEWSPDLQLRGGLAFDDSPIKTVFRGAGVPDSDRIIAAIGAGYALRDNLDIDFSYQHFFFKQGRIINRVATASRLIGTFDLNADWLALSVTWRF